MCMNLWGTFPGVKLPPMGKSLCIWGIGILPGRWGIFFMIILILTLAMEKTSRATQADLFTSVMERKRNETSSQARRCLSFSEERLSPREDVKSCCRREKWSLAASFTKNKSRPFGGLNFWWRWRESNPRADEVQWGLLHAYFIFAFYRPLPKPMNRPGSRLFFPLISPETERRLLQIRALNDAMTP